MVAEVDGFSVACGNRKLMKRVGALHIDCHSAGTIVHVAVNGSYAGHILISDFVKENTAEAFAELKKIGIQNTIMLTGDAETAAKAVAEETGIDSYYSELLPGDKVKKVEEMLEKLGTKEKLLFVGDGINDAPVLARADVGIAMGAIGSDSAIEAADVVIMHDDLTRIPLAIRIARKCIRIVYENIIFAIGIKAVCLILGALGLAGMWTAIFADVGVMVLAVLNATRALRI